MEPGDTLRRRLLETALADPTALERALQLAERAYGWLGDEGAEEPLALPAPAPAPAEREVGTIRTSAPERETDSEQRSSVAPEPTAGRAEWSEAEDDLLIQLYPAGAPADEIVAALPGRTIGACRTRAITKLGLKRPKPGDPPREELPVVATARRAAEWLLAEGVAEISWDEYGVFWRHHSDADEAEQLTPRQAIALADSERAQRRLPPFGDGADLAGGPHQSSLGGV